MNTAYITIWDKRVGAVAWDETTQTGTFEYEPSFDSGGCDLAPLQMPISAARGRIFSFPELRNSSVFIFCYVAGKLECN
jgi:serine/threonine-protein kinase HipA